jgi:hypothetical protein
MYYLSLLMLFFAVVYDFGNVGYVATIATNAVRLAAHDAVKNIDEQAFLDNQEVRLGEDALTRAQEFVTGMTGGSVVVNSLFVSPLEARDVIVIRASAVARLPVLGYLVGLNTVSIPIDSYAEPAYGIDEEGQ